MREKLAQQLARQKENELLASHPNARPLVLYLSSLAPSGRRTMLARLRTLFAPQQLADVPWHELRYEYVKAMVARMRKTKLSPASINTTLSAIKGVAREAWRLNLMSAEDYHRLCDVKGVRGSRVPRGRAIETDEIAQLFAVCYQDEGLSGVRDAALLALMIGCGLRRSEIAALRVSQVTPASVKVLGKGNKERLVYFGEDVRVILLRWVDHLPTNAFVFCPIRKNGRIAIGGLTDQALYKILRKRVVQAGLSAISPHDGRRTFISNLLDAGADLSAVQQLVGHANIATTANYDRRGERVKMEAAQLIHLPKQAV